MAKKEDFIQADGIVTEILPSMSFKVKLLDGLLKGSIIIAYGAGRMVRNRIRILRGDKVQVHISPYDLQTGRIVFRDKN